MAKIDLERVKKISEELYSDVMRLDEMFHRYTRLLTRIDDAGRHIKENMIIPIFFEQENKYEYEDDGNTHTKGIEVQCCWILPLLGEEVDNFGDSYKYYSEATPFEEGIFIKNDENGYVLLTYNAYIRTSDRRYRRCFTSLYYRKPNLAFDTREKHCATRITYINNNYDKDAIFFDLKSLAKLHREIADDYKKVNEFLEIEKLAMADDVNLYVKRY